MAKDEFQRSALLLGDAAMQRLAEARVILFGVGGVGSWAAETLVRTGLQHLTIVDFDRVSVSNINRQLPATTLTVGQSKVEAMRKHLLAINPDADIVAIDSVYSPDTADDFDLAAYDYIIDAIDSLRDKALLINTSTRLGVKIYSSMGAALRTDPTRIRVDEFWRVKGDRLAAALRNRFKRTGEYPARKFRVVYSDEPLPPANAASSPASLASVSSPLASSSSSSSSAEASPIHKPVVNGSLMQVTAPFGITLASLVINDLRKSL